MSEDVPTQNIASNDEVVNELTKDLQSQCIPNDEPKEKEDSIPEDFDKTDEEPTENNIVPDDWIDEDALREAEIALSDEEKELRKQEALVLKVKGNEEFKSGKYLESVDAYTEALRKCPLQYESDRSILYSNRAASKIKLERKKSAIDDCTKSIELNKYFKSYLRRAKMYEETDKLDEALEDYKTIVELDPGCHEAKAACVRLPPLINERNEKMKTEMLGKLKDLGNLFLKPFGLSTENFQLQQDPNSGGYSVNFQQNK